MEDNNANEKQGIIQGERKLRKIQESIIINNDHIRNNSIHSNNPTGDWILYGKKNRSGICEPRTPAIQ